MSNFMKRRRSRQVKKIVPVLLADFYKIGHVFQYPKGTNKVYSTWTPRGSRIEEIQEVVAYGLQGFTIEFLIEYFNDNFFNRNLDEVIEEYVLYCKNCLFIEEPDSSHIEALHSLGYLPIEVKAVPEGTKVPIRVPMFTVENTHDDFAWITNALETLISTETWSAFTVATIAAKFREILDEYAIKTTGSTDGVEYQGHDFSMRGMSSLSHGAKVGGGHLLSFAGSDTITAIDYLYRYYNGNITMGGIGCSVPATEHSVMCANMPEDRDESVIIRRLLSETYPAGICSIVCDTFDFWRTVTESVPLLKDLIMSRDGKFVIRPDSGDPVRILCGTVEMEDFTEDCKDLETAIKWATEEFEEEIREDAGHGEHGASDYTGYFRYDGKVYELKLDFFWNRHDKQYYYLDETTVKSCTEYEFTAEQKGLVEVLWDQFGGTVTEQGFKVLDSHIGCIYGDAITLDRCREICVKLYAKGFASVNVVLGIGSYSYNANTRDTFGQAFKSTYAEIKGVPKELFKDPKTDDGTKKSQKGRVAVYRNYDGIITYVDGLSREEEENFEGNMLETVFKDGELVRFQTLEEVREVLKAA